MGRNWERWGCKKSTIICGGAHLKRSPVKSTPRSSSGSRGPSRIDFILDIAAESFLEKGFEATSVTDIARIARASKETIYGKFPDKDALFRAVMQRAMDRISVELTSVLSSQAPLHETLSTFGERLLERMLLETGVRLQKIISMESQRFPELSRLFYELGPRRIIAALSVYLDNQTERGALRRMNSRVAAEHFVGILTSELMLRRSLGLLTDLTPKEKSDQVSIAIDVFLRAYGPVI
jgi:TetR/AcrR family transcriptional repressor of mexJK operon